MFLKWHIGKVPKRLKIKQVYGVIFTENGRVLLKGEKENDEVIYSLAGGSPETFDKGIEATLRRELIEEVNVTIGEPILLGYQEVDEQNGKPPYAQVRMVAMIDKIGKSQPDPDTGETYERLLTHPKKAIQFLNWGDIGKKIIEKAVMVATKEFGLKDFIDKNQIV
ncbi:MAG: hypothetical protein EOM55_02895 [Clostridia bacterium]|nr:hypothetical protein [Clostridia bacterium]